jgi:radical SAM-linked protein
MVYTKGFHPKPDMIFSPALSLGVVSLDEYVDIRLAREMNPLELETLVTRMNGCSPAGLRFSGAAYLGADDPAISKVIVGARYILAFARAAIEVPAGMTAEDMFAARCEAAMAATNLPIRRDVEGIGKVVDVRKYLESARVGGAEANAALARAGIVGDIVTLDVLVSITGSGAAKSSEIAAVIVGDGVTPPPHRSIRLELFGGTSDKRLSPLELLPLRKTSVRAEPVRQESPSSIAADAE